MNFMSDSINFLAENSKNIFSFITDNFVGMDVVSVIKMIAMWVIGGVLIFLAIKKDMEPSLLLPMGFGAILCNLPNSGAIGEHGVLTVLYNAGIANELFPLLLFSVAPLHHIASYNIIN